jgi:hypothetical protein
MACSKGIKSTSIVAIASLEQRGRRQRLPVVRPGTIACPIVVAYATQGASQIEHACVEAYQNLRLNREYLLRKRGRDMLQIITMLLLMVGVFGLFVGLVFFSEGVIAPESRS